MMRRSVPTLLMLAARATHSLASTRIMNVAMPKLPSGCDLELCEGLEDAEDNESAESLEELFSVGGTVWPCAAALCRWLSDSRERVRGARVLELGAGTGACGLYALGCGAAHATLTDHTPRLLKLMEKNCERNTLAGNLPGLGTATTISFEGFSWNASPRPKGQFDLVIGSDVRGLAFQPNHFAAQRSERREVELLLIKRLRIPMPTHARSAHMSSARTPTTI